jgi:hypothetical protein
MSTPYNVIFDKFIKKLKGDTQFFNHGQLTDEQINILVNDHLLSLLNRSIDKIYEYGNPDFNFHDKDDESQQFNKELVKQEISLLSEIMYFSYAEEDRNKLKVMGTRFRTSEVNVLFSPANDRKTYLEMIAELEASINNSISNYFSRNRTTWQMKSIYGGGF